MINPVRFLKPILLLKARIELFIKAAHNLPPLGMTANPMQQRIVICRFTAKATFPITHMYIDSEGWLNTPHGRCTSGDVALLWRFKWSAAQSQRKATELKAKIESMQSDSKMKMLIHTADYLNRLVKEISWV